MQWWQRVIDRLELDPVTAGLLAVMVLVRCGLSLRGVPRRRRRHRSDALAWFDAGLLAVATCFLVIRPFLMQIDDIRSPAMAPTLHGSLTPQIDGLCDRVVVARYLPQVRPPRRGEIVRFAPVGGSGEPCFGRIVGLPGELVEVAADGAVRIGGERLPEPYLEGSGEMHLPPHRVPAGMYFVLGDNRSRQPTEAWWFEEPFVPTSRLQGKAVAVCWPPGRIRLLR